MLLRLNSATKPVRLSWVFAPGWARISSASPIRAPKLKSTRVALDGDEETVVILAMRRSLGKGVRWHNSLWYYDAEDGSPTKLSTTDNDGLAFTTGIRVGF